MADADKDRLVSGDVDDSDEAQIGGWASPDAHDIGQDRVKHQLEVYITFIEQRGRGSCSALWTAWFGKNDVGFGDCQ